MTYLTNLHNFPGYNVGAQFASRGNTLNLLELHQEMCEIPVHEHGILNRAAAVYGALFTNYEKGQDEILRSNNLESLNLESLNDYDRFTKLNIPPIWAFTLTHVAAISRDAMETNEDFKFFKAEEGTVYPINFYDIQSLKENRTLNRLIPDVFNYVLEQQDIFYHAVAGAEARGLSYAGTMSALSSTDLIEVRKAGSIPGLVYQKSYIPEYPPEKVVEVRLKDRNGKTIVHVDDLRATGATDLAGRDAIEYRDGTVAYNHGKNVENNGIWTTSASLLEKSVNYAKQAVIPTPGEVVAFMHVIGLMI